MTVMDRKAKVPTKKNENGEEVVDWTRIDTQVKFEGREIKLPADPENMDFDVAIDTIGRVRDQENQKFDVNEVVVGAPWDVLVAIYRAMQEIYGVVLSESIKTWFGEIKPDFVTVHTGHKSQDRIQVPMGQMSLPGVADPVRIGMVNNGAYIVGQVRRRDRARLVEIANRAREIIRRDSVYKSKAVRLMVDEDGDLQLSVQPEFIDLDRVQVSDMIHTKATQMLIDTSIFAPLRYTEACRRNRVPLKRGILLEGRYGTGKSLTARVTAKVANDHGWTFIMLNRAQGLKAAIEFARQYQPCVIFAEDIDRAADREDESVNDLVNLLDGLITKDMEMMVVLTTNFIEKIDRSLLRPGRFDAVISIDTPDAETAERIVRAYAGDLLPADANLSSVGGQTAGMIPASIREVVERAKLGMLTEGRTALSADDLYASAIGMQRHMALLAEPVKEKSPGDRLTDIILDFMVAGGTGQAVADLATGSDLETARSQIMSRLMQAMGMVKKGTDYSAAAATNADKAKDYAEVNIALSKKVLTKVNEIADNQ